MLANLFWAGEKQQQAMRRALMGEALQGWRIRLEHTQRLRIRLALMHHRTRQRTMCNAVREAQSVFAISASENHVDDIIRTKCWFHAAIKRHRVRVSM